ncbi:methylmalonyl-CoA mutase family protein [Neobacillus sp. SM06]|uniref:methylmalonyl-CoA mutase family protein n=1 Tax=Neobacillus sp. SM06 TaxID=3422492 RepID=UPI003D2BED6A
MGLNDIRNQSFPIVSYEQWKEKAEESLKGKPIESLRKTTYEGIVLKPLYCEEDLKAFVDLPGRGDFRRGLYPFGYHTNNWKIAQKISASTIEGLSEKLQAAFQKGQTAIAIEISKELAENPEHLTKMLSGFYQYYPFAIHAKEEQEKLILELENLVKESERDTITGYLAADPLSSFSLIGFMPENTTDFFQKWTAVIRKTSDEFPNLKTVLINTTPYHNGGASAVQELGIAAAAGVFYLQTLLDNEMELEKALATFLFQFSIGASFFTEIAKLRAARVIWSKIAETFGASPAHQGVQIAAETSAYTKTVYDPHVNLLRAGNEAFAAVLGGVQYLHVAPFDELTGSSAFSERIARNTQLILQKEMNLQQAVDPAGGAWYIEALTNELAEKAWEFFQQIEARGGILETLTSNWLQAEIARVHEKRTNDSFTRKTSIIGTNVYANLTENGKNVKKTSKQLAAIPENQEIIRIKPIPQTRLSIPFEQLRNRAESLTQKPAVGFICLGSLKQHKPRMDYVKGFLAAGGIEGIASSPITTVAAAREFLNSCKTKHFCICGSDDLYETFGMDLLEAVKNEFPEINFYLAGLPDQEMQQLWRQKGISQFIHVKSNCHELLSAMLSEMEASLNEQAKA